MNTIQLHGAPALQEVGLAIDSVANSRLRCTKPDAKLIQEFFTEIDSVIDFAEKQTCTNLGETRFSCKRNILDYTIAKNYGNIDVFLTEYEAAPYFRGKNKMLLDVARNHIKEDIRTIYGKPQANSGQSVQRRTTQDIGAMQQGDFVLHVCGLFNLENPVTSLNQEQLSRFTSPQYRRALAEFFKMDSVRADPRIKSILPLMMLYFPPEAYASDRIARNTHPTSVLLQIVTGFTFHPNHQNEALLAPNSPYSFASIAKTISLKYFASKDKGKEADFFNKAFVAQDPCYDATVQNLMNYDPDKKPPILLFYPVPQWNDALPTDDNINGLIAWSERELLHDFLDYKKMAIDSCTIEKVIEMESSSEFSQFLQKRERDLIEMVIHNSGERAARSRTEELVHEDIELAAKISS